MKKIRVSYKLDKHIHESLKIILNRLNISSFTDIIKRFCDDYFSLSYEFEEEAAIILSSSNLYKYKNTQSYYIFLTNSELSFLSKTATVYGLSQTELISKIFIYIYNINYVTVDVSEAILLNKYEEKYKNKSMPFSLRVNQEQYNILKKYTDLCEDGPTDLVYIMLEEALSLYKKNKIMLLRGFSGYSDSKDKKYTIRANIPIKYYLRFLKFSYNISETPYSVFSKMLYSKTKNIEIV